MHIAMLRSCTLRTMHVAPGRYRAGRGYSAMGRAPAVPRVAGAAASNGNQRRPRAVGRRRRSSRMCSSGRRTRGRRTREGAKANARESVLRFSWPIRIVAAKWPHRHRSPDPPGRYTAGTRSGRQTTQQKSVVPWGGAGVHPGKLHLVRCRWSYPLGARARSSRWQWSASRRSLRWCCSCRSFGALAPSAPPTAHASALATSL